MWRSELSATCLTHRVALGPGSSLPGLNPGSLVRDTQFSCPGRVERALSTRVERDPGPSARIAKHNISSHSSYAIALTADLATLASQTAIQSGVRQPAAAVSA